MRRVRQAESEQWARAAVVAAVCAGIAVPLYSSGAVVLLHVLCIALLPVLMLFALKDRMLRVLWAVAALWAGGQLLSDFVHGTQLGSQPTLVAPAAALVATFMAWAVSSARVPASSLLLAGALGWVALEVLVGDAFVRGNGWKYGLALPVGLAVLAAGERFRFTTKTQVLVLLGLSGASVVSDARFATGVFLITAILIVLFRPLRNGEGRRSRWALAVAGAALLSVYLVYPAAAASGALGTRAYAQQVQYDDKGANFILATRLEMPQMLLLATRNLPLGVGANGAVSSTDVSDALQFVDQFVAPLSPLDVSYLTGSNQGGSGYKSHSAALASVLYAGVFAAPFWLFLIWKASGGLYRVGRGVHEFGAGPLVFLTIFVGWELLFSPLTNRMHVELALLLFILWSSERSGSIGASLSTINPSERLAGVVSHDE